MNRAIGRIIIGVAYGDAVAHDEEAKLLTANREALAVTTHVLTTVYLVNFIPARKSSDSYLTLASWTIILPL
jgi:hypothetical protein